MSDDVGIIDRCRFHTARPTRKLRLRKGAAPPAVPAGSVPKIARLLALAHHYAGLIDRSDVKDQADLAAVVGVSRARITQVMNLLMLAPDIQEEILFLPRTVRGRDPIRERHVRPLLALVEWERQREAWRRRFSKARL